MNSSLIFYPGGRKVSGDETGTFQAAGVGLL